jgi:predicted amidophosphoribosyltransferase
MEKQICPCCKKKVDVSLRYPNYICGDCVGEAKSEDGRPIKFYNENFSGGCIGEYTDANEKYKGSNLYINGIKCYAQEAHFGGIVIRPCES